MQSQEETRIVVESLAEQAQHEIRLAHMKGFVDGFNAATSRVRAELFISFVAGATTIVFVAWIWT